MQDSRREPRAVIFLVTASAFAFSLVLQPLGTALTDQNKDQPQSAHSFFLTTTSKHVRTHGAQHSQREDSISIPIPPLCFHTLDIQTGKAVPVFQAIEFWGIPAQSTSLTQSF